MIVYNTYHTERAEHEAEGYHGPRPPLCESIAAAVIVKHMATCQLEIHHRNMQRKRN